MATSAGRAGAARVSGRLRAGPALGAPLLQERTAKPGNTKTTGRRLPTRRRLNCANQRSEEHTSELQSLMRISYAVFCLKKQKHTKNPSYKHHSHNSTAERTFQYKENKKTIT